MKWLLPGFNLVFNLEEIFSSSSSYQTLQEASRPRDYDEDLPDQLDDDGYLLAFWALVSLETMGTGAK